MSVHLSDVLTSPKALQDAAIAGFQGRSSELSLVLRLLSRPPELPLVVSVLGPPGIGKTSFVLACQRAIHDLGLGRMLVLPAHLRPDELSQRLASESRRQSNWLNATPLVVGLDGVEEGIDVLLGLCALACAEPIAPTLILLAGLQPAPRLGADWMAWDQRITEIKLRELSGSESAAYLRFRGVREERMDDTLRFTGGHPLALSLAASWAEQAISAQESGDFWTRIPSPARTYNLMARMTREVTDRGLRELLEAASLVQTSNEELLGEMLGRSVRDEFQRFCQLSIVDCQPRGRTLNHVVRNLVASDLRRRRPELCNQLRQRALRYLTRRTFAVQPSNSHGLQELLFVSGEGGTMVPHALAPRTPIDRCRRALSDDHKFIRDLAREWVNTRSDVDPAQVFRVLDASLSAAPERFVIAEAGDGLPIGFYNTFVLRRATARRLISPRPLAAPVDLAEEVRAARASPARFPRPLVLIGYRVCSGQSGSYGLLSEAIIRAASIGWRLLVLAADPEEKNLLERYGFQIIPGAVSVRGIATPQPRFILDLRERGFAGWIHEIVGLESPAPNGGVPDPVAFQDQVKFALERLNEPVSLATSPLVELSVLSRRGAHAVTRLREMLVAEIKELAASPLRRDAESGALLFDYYVRQVGSHEIVAERLGLARATFYRRFHRGLALLSARLRAQALRVVEPAPSPVPWK